MAPLFPLALALIAGILMFGAVSSLWWICVPLAAAVTALFLRRTYYAILLLSVATGFVAAALRMPPGIPDSLMEQSAVYSGVVTEHREYEGAQMMIVRIDSCDGQRINGFLSKCLVPSVIPQTDETDRIRFSTTFSPLASETDLPEEIDYNAHLRRMGVTAEAIVVSDSIISVTAEPGFIHDIRRLRRPLQHLISTIPVSDGTRSFLLATLTGDREWLAPSTRTLFSSTGIAHILALSGLHVGVITALLLVLLMPLSGIRGGRYGRLVITILALWIFAILTGLSPSVVRAVIMATMFAVCTMLQRVWSPLNALSAAAIVIMLVTPSAIYSLGFILSFSAVLSIILFADAINPVSPVYRTARNSVGYPSVTVAAMLGTGVVCIYYFHTFPVYFLITNVAVSLMLPPLLGLGIILVSLNAFGVKALWLGQICDFIYNLIDSSAHFISSLPGALIDNIWCPGWIVWIYCLLIALCALYLRWRRTAILAAIAMIMVGATVIFIISTPDYCDSEVFITRSHTETTMLIKEGHNLYSYTTARAGAENEIIARDEARYRNYMVRRGIRSITPLADRTYGEHTARGGNMILAGGKSYVFIHNNSHVHEYGIRPDYAVVCRGFRGDITDVAALVAPDSILISSDLNLRRHDRYVRELTADSIPHRSLRHTPYHSVSFCRSHNISLFL